MEEFRKAQAEVEKKRGNMLSSPFFDRKNAGVMLR